MNTVERALCSKILQLCISTAERGPMKEDKALGDLLKEVRKFINASEGNNGSR